MQFGFHVSITTSENNLVDQYALPMMLRGWADNSRLPCYTGHEPFQDIICMTPPHVGTDVPTWSVFKECAVELLHR